VESGGEVETCELCLNRGETVLWASPACRVLRVDDPHYPGFCRVIWQAHVREMTDLDLSDRRYLMDVVFAVESVVRRCFSPDKINLASFGNVVPHVHWHIIPRWHDDRHFPQPVWGTVQRNGTAQRPAIDNEVLRRALSALLDPIEDQRRKPS